MITYTRTQLASRQHRGISGSAETKRYYRAFLGLTKRHFQGLQRVAGTSSVPGSSCRDSLPPGQAALILVSRLTSWLSFQRSRSSAGKDPRQHTRAARAVQAGGEIAR